MERPIVTKFGTVMRLGPADANSKQKFTISKIQDGGGRHFEKSKNLNIFATDWQILTKFGTVMRLCPADTVSK